MDRPPFVKVRRKDNSYRYVFLQSAMKVPLGDDPREPPIFEEMVLYHDREASLLFVEFLPFRRLPGGETEIPGVAKVRRPPRGSGECYRIRVEISADEATSLAKICSVTLPPEFLPEKPRPNWNRNQRELSYRGKLCRRYPRENAPNQFDLLDAFQAASWTDAVESPFAKKWTLSETIDGLNRGLDKGSPIHFHLKRGNPAWCVRVAPACSGN